MLSRPPLKVVLQQIRGAGGRGERLRFNTSTHATCLECMGVVLQSILPHAHICTLLLLRGIPTLLLKITTEATILNVKGKQSQRQQGRQSPSIPIRPRITLNIPCTDNESITGTTTCKPAFNTTNQGGGYILPQQNLITPR